MTESASVAGLSAEVRILHVGNGQITRSMYRQLDEVNLERFEAFGRVKDNKLKSGEGVLKLVGRDTKLERWSVTTHNRPWQTGQLGRDPLSSHIGCCTPRHTPRNTSGSHIRLLNARTGAALSGP
jgi:hypothetical protein